MAKLNGIHIIYVVEDGISTLNCGVGTIASHFVTAFTEIAAIVERQGNRLELSIITLEPQPEAVGIRNDLRAHSISTCSSFNGNAYFIENLIEPWDDYFNFEIWERYNEKAIEIIREIADSTNLKVIVIANDTIFAKTRLIANNIINIWIPHSLSTIHEQSYVDNKMRWKWENEAIEEIKANKNCYVGYISLFVKSILKSSFKLNEQKLIPFLNGFHRQSLERNLYSQHQINIELQRRGIPIDKNLVFAFGRADEYKGLEIALRSMIPITEKHNFHGVLIASAFSKEQFVSDIQQKLKDILNQNPSNISLFLGYEFDLPKFILQHSKTHFLLNLPTKDFCPLAPFEAELLGHNNLSIINSDINCFQSVIKHKFDGFLCSPTVESAVKTFGQIIELPEQIRKTVIKRGKQRTLNSMNIVANYGKAFEFILNKKLK